MEKSTYTTAVIRILVIGIACFGGYLFSQTAIFGNKLTASSLFTGTVCSFLAGVGFHLYHRKKERGEGK